MADVITVVNNGLGLLTDIILASGAIEPHHIGWGIGTTAADVTDTALETASAEARTTGTSSQVQTTTADDTYQVVGVITCATAPKAITEVGLFDTATNGVMFLRATFSAINLSVADSIEFTIKTVFDQA